MHAHKRPLRDLVGTSRWGHDAHRRDFRRSNAAEWPDPWTNDKGWVQPKSDIHKKAVHHLLTTAAAGRGCSPLRRSNPDRVRLTAARSDGNPSAALHVLDVAHTYFGPISAVTEGREARLCRRLAAIRDARWLVGID